MSLGLESTNPKYRYMNTSLENYSHVLEGAPLRECAARKVTSITDVAFRRVAVTRLVKGRKGITSITDVVYFPPLVRPRRHAAFGALDARRARWRGQPGRVKR